MIQIINYAGDAWRVHARGAERDGKVYCHLASTTRGAQQKNGWNPVQIGEWIELDLLKAKPFEEKAA